MRDNPRITKKERGLLKGAIRRVFARSDLRRQVLDKAVIDHKDESRPRVKKWVRCAVCLNPCAKYESAVDHVIPVVDVNASFEEQGADLTIDRTWCEENNLQVICPTCHNIKSTDERKARQAVKKRKLKNVK